MGEGKSSRRRGSFSPPPFFTQLKLVGQLVGMRINFDKLIGGGGVIPAANRLEQKTSQKTNPTPS